MRLLKIPSLFLCIILLSSCGPRRVYTTGTYGSIKSYTEKQHYVDQKTTNTYISGDVSFGRHMQEDGAFDDSKTITSINLHRNSTGRFYNYYFGLGASAGIYKFKKGYFDVIRDNEKKNFYTVNLKAGVNYTYTRPKIDFRFIGVEFAYNNEFGPYQDKLSDLMKVGEDLIIVNQKSLFSYNIYSEYAFKLSKDRALTLGFYLGDLISKKNDGNYSGESGFTGFTFGLRFKKYTFHLMYEGGENDIRSTKFGITYHL